MSNIHFRAWDHEEKKMYYRAYQKWFHVLLCDDDRGKNNGQGIPKKRARYDRCELMQSTTWTDKNGKEIFEGDRIRITIGGRVMEDVVGDIPDMFQSRKLSPLHSVFKKYGFTATPENFEIEVVGNRYE